MNDLAGHQILVGGFRHVDNFLCIIERLSAKIVMAIGLALTEMTSALISSGVLSQLVNSG
ncbi:MAG: hypothetical protein VCB06_03365 [Alphaproteobacteria bacterium]